jgi:hypothetical protein
VWLLLAALMIGGATWWYVVASRRRAWDERYAASAAEARWVHDVLTPSVLDRLIPVERASAVWAESRSRIDDTVAGLYHLRPDAPNEARAGRLDRLSASLTDLQRSVDADLALRSGPAPDPLALSQSEQAVTAMRAALLGALDDPTR